MRVTVIDANGKERSLTEKLANDKNYMVSMGLTLKEKPKAAPSKETAEKKPAAKKKTKK